jgi:RNA polymerase-binding transcription factor DksA
MERDTARQLLEAARRSTEALIATERAVASDDSADLPSGAATLDREQALTILLMAELHRLDVEDAIDRVAAGTFGRCDACGEAIAEERLEACPETRFCVVHEREWERRPPWHEAADPGWVELNDLPDDPDDVDDRLVAPEEAALHVEEVA